MRKLLFIPLILVAFCASAQTPFTNVFGKQDFKDSIKFTKYGNAGALDSIFTVDPVTKKLKFIKNGSSAPEVFTGVTSTTFDTTTKTLCVVASGITNCWVITTNAPASGAGPDSLVNTGNQVCLWFSGTPTCYTAISEINNFNSFTTYIDSSVTNIIYQTLGIDSATRLLDGQVIIDSGFDGHNTDLYYKILGRYFTADYSTFTIPGSHPTQNRWVTFYADTLGQIGQIQGSGILENIPQVDPESQVLLVSYYIPALSTTPKGVSSEWIYRNATYPGEFAARRGTVSTGYDSAYATNPFGGSGVSLRIPSMISGQYFEFQDGATHIASDYTSLDFYLRLSSTMPKNTRFGVSFLLDNQSVTVGTVLINSGLFGYDRTVINQWKPIAIRFNEFQFTNQMFDKIRFTFVGSASVSQQLDDIKLQSGGENAGGKLFVESVNGQNGHVQVIRMDSVSESANAAWLYYWDKRTGTKLDSSRHFRNHDYDTCFIVTTTDSINFFVAYNRNCGGASGGITQGQLDDSTAAIRADFPTGVGSGTVTNVSALTLGTSGTDLNSSVANSTTTPVITLNVPTASASNRGVLSTSDWTLFNAKQAALSGTGFVKQSGAITTYVPQVSLTSEVTGVLPVANGGTGTGSPGLVAGTNITSITGTWPNQTINAAGGGGGASAKAYSPLVVRNDSVYQRFNVLAYGADNTGTVDATAAIQAAINAAYAARGGTVFFPNGIYKLSGALVTAATAGIGNPNSQLYIPYESSFTTGAGAITIKLEGETPPTPIASALADVTVNKSGVILYSTIAGTGYYPSILSGKGIPSFGDTISTSQIVIENINFRSPANIGASGPTMSAANLRHMAFADVKNSMADLDTSGNRSVYPVAETFGFWMPYQNNGAYSPINNTLVTGYKYGYIFAEHSTGNNVNAITNEHAFVFKSSPHAINFGRLGAQWNKYTLTGKVGTVSPSTGILNPTISISQLDIEYQNPATYPTEWFSNRYIVYDSTNFLKTGDGGINFHIVERGVGINNAVVNKLGGTGVDLKSSRNEYITLTDGATITWNYAEGKNAKVTLAGNRTLVINNLVANTWGTLVVFQDATGGRTLTGSGFVSYVDGAIRTLLPLIPTLSTVTNLRFFYDGTAIIWEHTPQLALVGSDLNTVNTGNLTVGSATAGGKFSVVEGSSRIALGTVAPGSAERPAIILDNRGAGSQNTSFIEFRKNGTAKYFLGADMGITGAQDFSLYDNAGAAYRLYINSSGRMGLKGITGASITASLHLPAGLAAASGAPLKFTSGANLTTPEAGAVEFDGTNYFVTSSTTRYTLAKTLTNTAALDFSSTSAQTSSTLTITVTGAAVDDVVSLSVPTAAYNANSNYTAYVSATNTVTVIFNNYSAGAIDPASGTFRVSVIKY